MHVITRVLAFAITLSSFTNGATIFPRADEMMRLVWRHEDLSDQGGLMVAIDIYKADMTAQLTQNQICTSYEKSKTYTINTDNFANNPLTIEVDDDQGYSGTIKFAGKTYTLSNDAATNGGSSCNRRYNANSAWIECTIPVSSTVIAKSFPIDNEIDCLLANHDESTFSLASSPLKSYISSTSAPDQDTNTTLETREASPMVGSITAPIPQACIPYVSTYLSGNGNPHQNAWDKQLSENINCGSAPGCSVGKTQSTTYTINFSATATLAKWISGGFSVGKSWVTGDSYTCNGGTGDIVCIWYNTMHTAYTVYNFQTGIGTGPGCITHQYPDFVLASPNTNNAGGGYYCVIGTCRSKGENYWE